MKRIVQAAGKGDEQCKAIIEEIKKNGAPAQSKKHKDGAMHTKHAGTYAKIAKKVVVKNDDKLKSSKPLPLSRMSKKELCEKVKLMEDEMASLQEQLHHFVSEVFV